LPQTHINFHQVAPVIMPSSGLEVRVQESHLRGLMAELMEVAKANGGNRHVRFSRFFFLVGRSEIFLPVPTCILMWAS
jgi:hypothetical protein